MPDSLHDASSGQRVFRLFKYVVYALLCINVYLFFSEEAAASGQFLAQGITWANFIQAFSATVDTLAWVILLLLFELETAVIPDDRLRGRLKWVLSGVRGVCYTFIVYSFYGYATKYIAMAQWLPLNVSDACTLLGQGYVMIETLDQYAPVTAETCASMAGQPLLQIADSLIVGNAQQLTSILRLALVDVVNSATWLVIVFWLEVEVMLQLAGRLTPPLMAASKYAKALLYTLLLVCAVYWGVAGDFLDFWDAFLWLVAFVFIEMNLFQWNAETRFEIGPPTPASS